MDGYHVTQTSADLWQIRDEIVHMFLIAGKPFPVLIDTGFGKGRIRDLVTGLAGREPRVILTHGHGDHIGGLPQFKCVFAHPADLDEIDPGGTYRKAGILTPVTPGDWVSDQSPALTVIHTPGHTPGSLTILDRKNRRIFVGDIASPPPVYMCLPGADMKQYHTSLKLVYDLRGQYDTIYANHAEQSVPIGMLEDYIELSDRILRKTAESAPALYFDRYPCLCYSHKSASVLV